MSVHQDCRMYEAKYPEVDDVVMVQVSDVVRQQADCVTSPLSAAHITHSSKNLVAMADALRLLRKSLSSVGN